MRRLASITACAVLITFSAAILTVYLVGSSLISPAHTKRKAAPAGLPVQEISFESSSGSLLSGWLMGSGQRCGTVVLMHGVRANKRAMLSRAKLFAEAGYGVFMFDFQAHGESSGEAITFGYLEQKDAAAAMQFVSKQWPGRPIAVIGVSLGGAAAVLNGRKLGADAIVLEAVYSTLEKAVINRVRLRTGNLDPLAKMLSETLLFQLKLRLGIDAEHLRPIDQISAIDAPLLMIAGNKDQHTTLNDSQQLFERARQPKNFWLVENAGHVDFYRYDPRGYAKNVLKFLGEHITCK